MPALLAFTESQVEQLTGLSQRTLRSWEEMGIFHPSFVADRPNVPHQRIYSFRDLVSLRTLAKLRRDHRINLDELRQVGQYLSRYYDAPWTELRFSVADGHVALRDPGSSEWVSVKPFGQRYISIEFDDIRREMEADAAKLRERRPDDIGEIDRHRDVMSNAWVIAGTRIPTSTIWHFFEDGYDVEAILREYPSLTAEDVDAALQHERQIRGVAAA